jgi:hypothetical protein
MGYLFYYKNYSTTAGTHSLTYTNDQLGFVKSDPEKMAVGHSTPFIGRMDNSPKEYLVMGSRSGRIFRYTGFEGGNVFSAYKRMDSAYSFILSSHSNVTSYMSAPAIADIDADGQYDMVLGNVYGGLLLYKQVKSVSIQEEQMVENGISIFPNPAKNELFLKLEQTFRGNTASVFIYNSMGQKVKSFDQADLSAYWSMNIADLPSAVYYCLVQTKSKRYKAVFVKQS